MEPAEDVYNPGKTADTATPAEVEGNQVISILDAAEEDATASRLQVKNVPLEIDIVVEKGVNAHKTNTTILKILNNNVTDVKENKDTELHKVVPNLSLADADKKHP